MNYFYLSILVVFSLPVQSMARPVGKNERGEEAARVQAPPELHRGLVEIARELRAGGADRAECRQSLSKVVLDRKATSEAIYKFNEKEAEDISYFLKHLESPAMHSHTIAWALSAAGKRERDSRDFFLQRYEEFIRSVSQKIYEGKSLSPEEDRWLRTLLEKLLPLSDGSKRDLSPDKMVPGSLGALSFILILENKAIQEEIARWKAPRNTPKYYSQAAFLGEKFPEFSKSIPEKLKTLAPLFPDEAHWLKVAFGSGAQTIEFDGPLLDRLRQTLERVPDHAQ